MVAGITLSISEDSGRHRIIILRSLKMRGQGSEIAWVISGVLYLAATAKSGANAGRPVAFCCHA
jgi:hypothetical protein